MKATIKVTNHGWFKWRVTCKGNVKFFKTRSGAMRSARELQKRMKIRYFLELEKEEGKDL